MIFKNKRGLKAISYKLKPSGGFTLIEILVAVAIIGILMVVVLASLSTARAKGRDAKRAGDIKQMQQALENYFENNSAYPPSDEKHFIPTGLLTYLSSIPADPVYSLSEQHYYYGCTLLQPDCKNYCLAVQFESTVPSSLGPSSGCVTGYNYSVEAYDSNSSPGAGPGDSDPVGGGALTY